MFWQSYLAVCGSDRNRGDKCVVRLGYTCRNLYGPLTPFLRVTPPYVRRGLANSYEWHAATTHEKGADALII